MKCYLISYGGKRYATSADNLLEAETKFIEAYPEAEDGDFRIADSEVTPEFRADELVVWF